MEKIKNLQIKRPLSLLLAFGMLACAKPIAVCNKAEALTEGSVNLEKTVFSSNEDLNSTWGKISIEQNGEAKGELTYSDGTGQKLYFGAKEGEPLQWWVCGRLSPSGTNADDPIPFVGESMVSTGTESYSDALVLYNAVAVDHMFWYKVRENNYANSDIKKYLEDSTGNSPTITSNKYVNGGFSGYFTRGELQNLMESEVNLANAEDVTSSKFYVPSGLGKQSATANLNKYNVMLSGCLSWGAQDPSALSFTDNDNAFSGANANKNLLIPFDHWALTPSETYYAGGSWLRSPNPKNIYSALCALRNSGGVGTASVDYASLAVAPACKINLSSVAFASAARSAAFIGGPTAKFSEISGEDSSSTNPAQKAPGMYLRFASEDVHEPTVTANTITGTAGETVTIQGCTDGIDWSYSKKLSESTRGIESQVTLDEVNEAGFDAKVFSSDSELTSFEEVTVWSEKLGTGDQEGLLLTSATPKDNTPEPPTPGNPNPNEPGNEVTSPPNPNEPGNGGNKPNAPGNGVTSPPTGDNLQTWLWLGGAGIGMISVGVAIFYRRYRKRGRRA